MRHPDFQLEHVVENIRRLRLLRNRLPLQTIRSHRVPIQNLKTPSTSTPFKEAYTISVTEHIRRVLNNKTLQSQMYFGPGIEVEVKSEFWHGNIWQASPLFGQYSVWINQGILVLKNLFKGYYQ